MATRPPPACCLWWKTPTAFCPPSQVAITLSGFLGAAFGTENFSGYLTDFLVSLNLPLPENVLTVISMVVITIVISFFSIAFGEMVPKRVAMQQPYAWAKTALGVMRAISLVFAPMMALLNVTTNGTLRMLGLKTEAEDDAASEEDIRLMVENSGEQAPSPRKNSSGSRTCSTSATWSPADAMTPEPDVTALQPGGKYRGHSAGHPHHRSEPLPRLRGGHQRHPRHPQCP